MTKNTNGSHDGRDVSGESDEPIDPRPRIPDGNGSDADVHIPADATVESDATFDPAGTLDIDVDVVADGGVSSGNDSSQRGDPNDPGGELPGDDPYDPGGELPGDDTYDPVDVFSEGDLDLREGADSCYKCTSCDTSCPVAEVDDEFPGPKFQGPEQWRLKRKEDAEIDPSVMSCSNCMRCDDACPTGVPLSQMHNEARGEYVNGQLETLSREYVRNRILSNYRTFAEIGSGAPRVANFVTSLGVTRWLNEKLLGITSEREFPDFADQTFREWWLERGGARVEDPERRVAYFHGCYTNYNTPEVGKALVRVFERFDYEVLVPEQGCSGTPMFANGMLADARREAETTVPELAAAIDGGADVVASCTSCSLSLRQEYPELFDLDRVEDVAERTYEALEYLRIHEDLREELADSGVDAEAFAYHGPCHARNQGLHRQAVELFDELDGAEIEDVGDSCSGISGTYGWKTEKYETSMTIGEEMFNHMDAVETETGMTECPTCAMQMEHGTGYEIRHPLELLEDALVD